MIYTCLLYTSDAADEEDSVDLGGRRITKKKTERKKKKNNKIHLINMRTYPGYKLDKHRRTLLKN